METISRRRRPPTFPTVGVDPVWRDGPDLIR
jgi:hypothetical protein